MAVLKLPDELYWELSPREIHGCIVEYGRMQDVENHRAGTICATLRNVQRAKESDKVWQWSDFFNPLVAQPKKQTSLERLQAQWQKSHEALQNGALRTR